MFIVPKYLKILTLLLSRYKILHFILHIEKSAKFYNFQNQTLKLKKKKIRKLLLETKFLDD